MMDRYFLAALIVGGLVAVAGAVAGLYRRRGVPPANIEVREELARQGIVALHAIAPPDSRAIDAAEREQAELLEMRAIYLRQQAGMAAKKQNLAATQAHLNWQTADIRERVEGMRNAYQREVFIHTLLQDPEPSAEAETLAARAIRRAQYPHPPLQ